MADTSTVSVDDSILLSIKKLIGLGADYTPFDTDIKIHINTYLGRLWQNGIGRQGYRVTSNDQTWADFLGADYAGVFASAVDYVYMKCRIIFDPPQNSSHLQALKEASDEILWTLNALANPMVDLET